MDGQGLIFQLLVRCTLCVCLTNSWSVDLQYLRRVLYFLCNREDSREILRIKRRLHLFLNMVFIIKDSYWTSCEQRTEGFIEENLRRQEHWCDDDVILVSL